MSRLVNQIKEDIKQAMRERDTVKLDTLRGLLSAFTYELVESGKTPRDEIDEASALKVIKRAIKQRKDAIEQFKANNREDLVEKEEQELQILENYLPAQASKDEIKQVATKLKQELESQGAVKNPGILIGQIIKHFQGNVDGKLVKEVVEEIIQN